ncbi:MAG: FecR family protein [Gammaproteobacteria bacterium]
MTTIKFPNRAAATEAAAIWIAKIDRGLSDDEQHQLNDWLGQASLHGEALIEAATMWDMLDVLQPISKVLPMSDVRIEDVAEASDEEQPDRRQGIGWFAVAASVLLAAGALAWLGLPSSSVTPDHLTASRLESAEPVRIIRHYQTKVGETATFDLADGSIAQLNTDSTIAVEYSARHRHIELIKGEVFFEVARNPDRPFVVESGDDRVTAVGTAFSVDSSTGQSMEVIVTEGKVVINRKPGAVTESYPDVVLTPGQRVVVRDNQPDVSADEDPDASLAWREGYVVFKGESLAQVVREIDRYTPLSFEITDPDLATIPVGGFFKTGDLEQLLLVLQQNFGVAHQRDGNRILLSRLAP